MKSLFEITSPRRVPLNFLLLLLILSTAVVDHASAFGIMGRATTSLSKVFRVMTTDGGAADTTMAEIAEAVDGEIYANAFLEQQSAQDEVDSVVDATDKLLSKRVPVAIRYSADSGMKPYFLTAAKKLKEVHPDIILDKVILPKVEVSDSGGSTNNQNKVAPIFEVMVDGKVVIPTVGKKDRDGMGGQIIFVSMHELEVAITRARRRRRPSTVYGEEEANVRLELLKIKAAGSVVATSNSVRNSHKLSND